MALIDQFDPVLSGLDIVRRMLAEQLRPTMLETFQVTLVEAEPGRVLLEADPGDRFLNPIGTVHGGWHSTLLDTACGLAVFTRVGPGQRFTTLELKVAFHRALTPQSGLARAEGLVTSMGRRIAYTEAKLTDAQGRLCASATSTLMVLEAG